MIQHLEHLELLDDGLICALATHLFLHELPLVHLLDCIFQTGLGVAAELDHSEATLAESLFDDVLIDLHGALELFCLDAARALSRGLPLEGLADLNLSN